MVHMKIEREKRRIFREGRRKENDKIPLKFQFPKRCLTKVEALSP